MPIEDDGNLEDLLTAPPESESPQEEAVGTEVQAESNPQLQASEAQAPPAVSSLPANLVSRAKAAGLQLEGVNDPAQLAEMVIDRWNQERPYAEFGRTSLSGNISKADHNKPNAQEQGEDEGVDQGFDEEGHFNSLWKTAELDDACKFAIQNGIVMLGEDGLFQAKPGYETMALPLLQSINQSHIAQKEQLNKLFEGNFYQNIDKGLWPAFEARINRVLNERLNNQFQTYEQQVSEKSFVDRFVTENKSWLYDATGNNLSPEGLKFQQTVQELRNNGITDPQVLANYAIKIAGINTNAGATQSGQPSGGGGVTPAPNTDRPRDEHGRFLPPGTAAPAAPPKTKQETFIDRARRHVTKTDNRGGGGLNSGADYQVANEADLENMFTDAWKHAAVV